MTIIRRLIRTDGTTQDLPAGISITAIRELMGAEGLDTVNLHHLGMPLHVMFVDDGGYETAMIDHGGNHFEMRPTRAIKPLNREATRLYHLNCKPGVEHQIVGDVVIVPDEDSQ